jgi:hypothetical protein
MKGGLGHPGYHRNVIRNNARSALLCRLDRGHLTDVIVRTTPSDSSSIYDYFEPACQYEENIVSKCILLNQYVAFSELDYADTTRQLVREILIASDHLLGE